MERKTKEILTFAVDVGSLMLSSGAEIYRVKETIVHMIKGLGIEDFDVYVVSNGIFASAHENREMLVRLSEILLI